MDLQQIPGIPDPRDAEKNRVMAVLAYIIFIIPLIAARESPFATFHGNQGLVLFLTALVGWLVLTIIPIIGWLLLPVWQLILLLFAIIGIINASKGVMKPLPIIGGITIIK